MSGSDRVRVLLVSPSFGAYGGIEAFVFAVERILRDDPRFTVRICFKRVSRFRLQPQLERFCREEQVELCDKASRELWNAIAWADVIHGQNASPDIAVVAALLRKPLVLSLHNVLPRRPLIRRWLWQLSAKAAGARWYNSEFVWRSWERVPSGASSRLPPMSSLRSVQNCRGFRKGYVFLGRLIPGKGVDVLLDAYQRAELDPDQWPLTIFGEGPLREDLEARYPKAKCPGISFGGFVDGDAKATALSRAKWIVIPSHWGEPFGLVALEARYVGTPCLIARDGGLPEAAGRDALHCEPGDPIALAALLRTAAAMPEEEYRQRAIRTKADLENELVPPTFYPEAYLRLVNGRRSGAPWSPDASRR